MKLTHILERAARYHPDSPAVTFNDKTWNWSQFLLRAQCLGGALKKLGVQADDRVAALAFNCNRLMELFYAPFYAEAVFVPLNYRWALPEMLMCMEDCTPTILFVDEHHVEQARHIQRNCDFCRHLVYIGDGDVPEGFLSYDNLLEISDPSNYSQRAGDDLAVLFYTGGTTGRSKGVMLTHANLFINSLGVAAALSYDPACNFLQSAPLFHLGAGQRVYSLAMANCHSVLMQQFEPEEALRFMEKYHINDGLFVPTMINMILNVPSFGDYDLSSMHRISYGAAPMAESLVRQVMTKLPKVDFYQSYGATETSPLVTVLTPADHDLNGPNGTKLASIGKPVYHCEVKIVDSKDIEVATGEIGELLVRGPNIMKGYWNMPELTAEVLRGGWYHTGDGGYIDNDGYIFLVDRVKDMIISGGENVYSGEVENILHQHPAVKDAAIIGVPHDVWGEAVHAIVTFKQDQSISAKNLIAFCQERIASYKCPKSIDVIDKMPLSGANKILKSELRKLYWANQKKNSA